MSRFSSRFPGSERPSRTAWHDPLTGALTRQHFLGLLEEEKRFADEEGSPFSIALIDVDGLRSINDGRGQMAGDAVLAAAAGALRALLVKPPWHELEYSYARFDGGSLMLLARRCRLEYAHRLAEAYRHWVAESPLVEDITVTVSIGVAQYRLGEETDALVAGAERTLHLAKQFGRDRVEAAPVPPGTPQRADVIPLESPSRPARRREP